MQNDSTDPDVPPIHNSTLLAATGRALSAPILFYFKSPLKLFRPARVSSWSVLRALAEAKGHPRVDLRFIRVLRRREGWLFIPKLLFPPIIANGLIGFTLFAVFSKTERVLLSENHDRFTASVVSGALAGFAQSVVSTPIDNLKDEFRLRYLVHKDYSGVGDYITAHLKSLNQVKHVYRNISWIALKDSLGFALFFGSFEYTKMLAYRWFPPDSPKKSGEKIDWRHRASRSFIVALGGINAAFLYQLINYPFEKIHFLAEKEKLALTCRKRGLFNTLYGGMTTHVNWRGALLPAAIGLLLFDVSLDISSHVYEGEYGYGDDIDIDF